MKTHSIIAIFSLLIFYGATTVFSQQPFSDSGLTGKWKFEADIKDFGNVSLLLDIIQTSDSTFSASSREHAMKEIVGGSKQFMANLFTKRFKKGRFVTIFNGVISGDSLRGIFSTPVMTLYFSGQFKNGSISGALGDNKFGNNKKVNYPLTAIPHHSERLDYDYSVLNGKIKETFSQYIYDAEVLSQSEWKSFFKKMDKMIPDIHDDFEMFVGFSSLSQQVNMSHIGLLKYHPWDHADTDTVYEPMVRHEMIDEQTAYIQFDGFALADTSIVRNFFDTIISRQVPNLIIDMRGCSGGDYSSMFLASYLIKEPLDAGFFIGNKYFREKRELPDAKTLNHQPVFKGNSIKEFLDFIVENGLLAGTVYPDKTLHYQGKVTALIDGKSASATEPIAYFLKQHGLAALIGETTAGAMLSSTVIHVKDSWNLLIPTADYYTSDRFRIEGKGVKPDVKVKSEKALEYVKNQYIKM